MPDRTPRETALAYMDAWNAMDAAGCAACFAEDGVREGRILARATAGGARFPRFVGREAIRERIAGFMVAVPDLSVEVTRVGEGPADTAWLEWRLTGTHRADWGAWAARGERVERPGGVDLPGRRGAHRRGGRVHRPRRDDDAPRVAFLHLDHVAPDRFAPRPAVTGGRTGPPCCRPRRCRRRPARGRSPCTAGSR